MHTILKNLFITKQKQNKETKEVLKTETKYLLKKKSKLY